MSIWGKLIGGVTGMALGGPIGAIMGIAAGHGVDKVRSLDGLKNTKYFSKDEKQQIFATSVISLSAKLAKVDGNVSKEEILIFKRIFDFPKEDEKDIANIFKTAKEYPNDHIQITSQVYEVFKNDKPLLHEILHSLFSIAYADGIFHPKEKNVTGDFQNF